MTNPDMLQWVGLAASWALTVATVAYNRWNALYLLVSRLRYLVTNPTALWSVRVTMSGAFDGGAMDRAVAGLKQHWPDARKQLHSDVKRVLRAEGMLLEVQLEQGSGDAEAWPGGPAGGVGIAAANSLERRLLLHIGDVRASYRESGEVVDRITSVVDEVVRAAGARKVEFGTTVRFPSGNPYLGLYLRRLRGESLRSFLCSVAEPVGTGGGSSTVTIGAESIEVFSTNAVQWGKLSKRYLAVR